MNLQMKKLILLVFLIISVVGYSQTITYLKVADKEEFTKFMNYCQTPVPRTFYMTGEVSLVKYNADYTNTTLYWKQPVTGDWMAKYPLVIKWYPIGTKSTITEAYQQQIQAKIEMMVPRVYCTSKTEYITLFYNHWKNGDMQAGWFDSHYIGVYDFMK